MEMKNFWKTPFFAAIIFAILLLAILTALKPAIDLTKFEAVALVLVCFGLFGLARELKKFKD